MNGTQRFLIAFSSLLIAFTTGCDTGRASSSSHHDEDHNHTNWHYTEGRGISLTPQGQELIGLTLSDVTASEDSQHLGAVTIPSSALLRTIRGDFVYVRNGSNLLKTPINLLPASDDRQLITDSLFEGDQVVSQGAKTLWLIELQATNGGVACTDGH
jgi:hypothetical protein